MADNQALLQGAVAMSTISVALLIVFLVALMNPELLANVRGRVTGAAGQAGASPTGKIIVGTLGAFAPDMMILFGFISDIINVQFRHSVLSFTAILGVVLNRFIFGTDALAAVRSAAATVTGVPAPAPTPAPAPAPAPAPSPTTTTAAATTAAQVATTAAAAPAAVIGHTGKVTLTGNPADVSTMSPLGGQRGGALPQFFVDSYNPCAIRGLAFLDTNKSPMGMVALMTIFTAVFWDMWINNKRTTSEIVGNGVFGLVVLILNFMAYSIFDCYGSNSQDRLFATFKAFVWGAIVGSTAFLIFQYAPGGSEYLPLDASPASLSQPSRTPVGPGGQQECPPGQISSNGRCVPAPSSGAQCSAPNDDDQFVCDAYKNGKLVSTTFSS
jgi:hypothetical protein